MKMLRHCSMVRCEYMFLEMDVGGCEKIQEQCCCKRCPERRTVDRWKKNYAFALHAGALDECDTHGSPEKFPLL